MSVNPIELHRREGFVKSRSPDIIKTIHWKGCVARDHRFVDSHIREVKEQSHKNLRNLKSQLDLSH
jgi:hypothetical protein